MGDDGNARDETSAADGNDDERRVRYVLENLQSNRSLSGDHGRIVKRMDGTSPLGLQPFVHCKHIVHGAVQYHLGPESARGIGLARRSMGGHNDDAPDAVRARRVRDRLRVIAGRDRHDPARAVLGRQLAYRVDGTRALNEPVF